MEQQQETDNIMTGRAGRILTDIEKVSLLTLIKNHHYEHTHQATIKTDNLLELFFGDRGLRRHAKELKVLILRLLDTCPPADKDRKVLADNLIEFCRHKSADVNIEDDIEEDVLRKLELDWASRLLHTIDRFIKGLGQKTNVTNKRIMKIFIDIARQESSVQYCLGSKGIENAVQQYIQLADLRSLHDRPSQRGAKIVPPSEYHKTLDEHFPPAPPAHTTPVKSVLTADHEEEGQLIHQDAEDSYTFSAMVGTQEVVLKTTKGTPVKLVKNKERAPTWTDYMKRQLLSLYLKNSQVLHIPGLTTKPSKAAFRKALNEIFQNESIIYNGMMTPLRELASNSETLAQLFVYRGLKCQQSMGYGKSLADLIVHVMRNHPEKDMSTESIRSMIEEIESAAINISDEET